MRTLSGHCYDLSFLRPNVKQICAAIKTVCFKEKISIDPQALTEMVVASGQDMRQVRGVSCGCVLFLWLHVCRCCTACPCGVLRMNLTRPSHQTLP